jgi:rRNA maturation endonuclease Nob1
MTRPGEHGYRCEGCHKVVNPDIWPSPGEPDLCAECFDMEEDAA